MKPLTRTDMRQFGGMASAYDPHDLTGGMVQHQENLVTTVPGELAGRRGYALTLYTQGSLVAGSPVIAAYNFQHPLSSGGFLVYQCSNGTLRAALL